MPPAHATVFALPLLDALPSSALFEPSQVTAVEEPPFCTNIVCAAVPPYQMTVKARHMPPSKTVVCAELPPSHVTAVAPLPLVTCMVCAAVPLSQVTPVAVLLC